MQVEILQQRFQALLLLAIQWLAGWCGAELVQAGWRQIPDGHQSFDPALADYFKGLKMRNGKHTNLAVSYSVVAKWNSSNQRRGQSEWTYGSDRHYAANYTDVDRKTWGQHMDELAKLGLVAVSQIKGKPAYKAIPYQILNAQLCFLSAPSYGRDAQKVAHDAHTPAHHAQHITEESITEKSGNGMDLKPSAPAARAVDADVPKPAALSENIDHFKAQIPEVRPVAASDEGDDELMHPPATDESPRLTHPVPRPPPAPDDDTDPDGCSEAETLQAFFTGKTVGEIKALINKHGLKRIYATIKGAAGNKSIENPPGFVLAQLEKGVGGQWRLPDRVVQPGGDSNASWWEKAKASAYADFYEH